MSMKKIGTADLPEKIKEYYNDEIHEFLVAVGGGSTGGSSLDNKHWTANVPILGYIDLVTKKQSDNKGSLRFVLTDEENETRQYFKYFEQGTIYKIKGMLPKMLGDSRSDNIYRMSGLYVTEVVSKDEKDGFLQGLIDEFNKVVTINSEAFGELILNKELGWYEGKGIWLGEEVGITIAAEDEDKDVSEDLLLAEQFFAEQTEWNKKIREYAAEELTDLANDWLADSVDDEDEEPQEITEEDFAKRITIDSICFDEDGEFTVYFGDDDMFWGHSVVVYGDVENGPNEAQMEG